MLSAPVCSGYSGCKITISNGRVIKSTNGSYPIGRLVKQANKQKKFAAMKYDGVLIPEVLSCESDSKDCHITMEYFSCLNVIEYLNRASKGDLDKISKTVCSFVESNINSSEMVELDKGVIVDKFEFEDKPELREELANYYTKIIEKQWNANIPKKPIEENKKADIAKKIYTGNNNTKAKKRNIYNPNDPSTLTV